MASNDRLYFADGAAENPDVAFDQSRGQLHEDEPANMRSGGLGERGQSGKHLRLCFAVHTGGTSVEYQQYAPCFGKGGAHQNGRRLCFRATSPINDKSAVFERRHAYG